MIIAQRTIPALRPPEVVLSPPTPTPSPSVEDTTAYPPPATTPTTEGFLSSQDNFTNVLGDTDILFIGGVSFILSGGNDEKIKKAVNTIRYAIVGLIITIFSFTFVTIVGRFFGLNLLDYISWEMVKNSIENVVQTTKGSKTTIPRR